MRLQQTSIRFLYESYESYFVGRLTFFHPLFLFGRSHAERQVALKYIPRMEVSIPLLFGILIRTMSDLSLALQSQIHVHIWAIYSEERRLNPNVRDWFVLTKSSIYTDRIVLEQDQSQHDNKTNWFWFDKSVIIYTHPIERNDCQVIQYHCRS